MSFRNLSIFRPTAFTSFAILLLACCASTIALAQSPISAIWANDGGDKVTQDELRATNSPTSVYNSVWNGTTISQFGAKNEVVSFNLVLEAASAPATNIGVTLSNLTGPGGFTIRYALRAPKDFFNWTTTDSEIFFVRYLQIQGLSYFGYPIQDYDEIAIPEKMQCSPVVNEACPGGWDSRPNHDKFYPDIAVPIDLEPWFNIAAGNNQSIWTDIYIPETAPAGAYTGTVNISQNGVVFQTVPVTLTVRNFTLPDTPSYKTMVYTSYGDVMRRYTGLNTFPAVGTPQDLLTEQVLQNQRLLAHRHKISLIGDDGPITTGAWTADSPSPGYVPALTGTLFTAANGYAGPGVGVGNNVYSIGTYGTWQSPSWPATQAGFWTNTNNWESWFETNSPSTERFVYLIDESTNYTQTQQWADWMATNPGIGAKLNSMATLDPMDSVASVPSLNVTTSLFAVGYTPSWQAAVTSIEGNASKRYFMYNGERPGEGSFCTDCDGTDLREQPWGGYKKGVDRWYYWEATYYDNYQDGGSDTNVFNVAQTFGSPNPTFNPDYGMQSYDYSNGDGLLFYPGTDAKFPAYSYGIAGPLASLRLKDWRRGIQDVDYLTLASAINPTAVANIVNTMVPQAMWELPVTDPNNPTYYVNVGPSWNSNPDNWEAQRLALAHIIDGQ